MIGGTTLATEIERDAQQIMQTLYTWTQGEDDPRLGRYSLGIEEVIDATGLDYDRAIDAAKILEQQGWLDTIENINGIYCISSNRNHKHNQPHIQKWY